MGVVFEKNEFQNEILKKTEFDRIEMTSNLLIKETNKIESLGGFLSGKHLPLVHKILKF